MCFWNLLWIYVCLQTSCGGVGEWKITELDKPGFWTKGKKEGESSDDEQENPEKGGQPSEEKQENPEKEEELSDEIEKNPDESNAFGKFSGLFAVLLYFPSWLYSYILWRVRVWNLIRVHLPTPNGRGDICRKTGILK